MYILLDNEILYINIIVNNSKLDSILNKINNHVKNKKDKRENVIYTYLYNLLKTIRQEGINNSKLKELSKYKFNNDYYNIIDKNNELNALEYDKFLKIKKEIIISAYNYKVKGLYKEIIDCFKINFDSYFKPINVYEFVNYGIYKNDNELEREKNKKIYLESISNTNLLNLLGINLNDKSKIKIKENK